MAKKRVNKIEEKYKKFTQMTPEEMQKYTDSINQEMINIEEHIVNKEKEIEGREATIDLTTDPDKKYVLSAQKETAEQELEDLLLRKEKQQKSLTEIENYTKNKDKIQKVLGYQHKLNERKEKIKAELNNLSKELELKNSEMIQIDRKLEHSEELTNHEYNDLIIQKEKVQKEIEQKERKITELEKRIISLTGSVSKCDLVWKNLMLGKSWDEIHAKALNMNKKYVPSKEEMEAKQNFVNVLSKIRDKKQAEIENNSTIKGKVVQKVKDKAMTKYDEFAEKHPRLAKLRDALLALKNKFKRNKPEGKEQEENQQEEPETASKRDAFIEQLQKNLEQDEIRDKIKATKTEGQKKHEDWKNKYGR